MIKGINEDINNASIKYSLHNPYTNVYGLARSLLAIGTLLTLLFNNWDLLFPKFYVQNIKIETIFDELNIFILFGYNNINIILFFCIIILVLVISGVLPQITSVFHFWISYSFFRYCPIIDGGDQITLILTLTLIPFAFFDNRLNHWSNAKNNKRPYINICANIILLFIQIQMSFLYFHSFIEKLKVEEWINGTVVYYWFTNNVFGFPTWLRQYLEPLMHNALVVTTITWGTLVLEFLLFIAIFLNSKWKKRIFILGIIFHFGILLIHGLVSFFFAMSGGLILYLLPPSEMLIVFQNLKSLTYVFSRKTTSS